jgi:hypothetical protein
MKTSYFTVLFTLACVLGLGISARAEDGSSVAVTVPFQFVAGAKTMPAGRYSIARCFPEVDRGLIIRDYDTGVFLLPIVFDGVPAEHTKLSFERVGSQYFLSKVETPAGIYTIRTSRAMTKIAQLKDNVTLSSPGGN